MATMELERERHNAGISERYRQITEREEFHNERQSVQASVQTPARVSTPTYYAPIVNNTPVMDKPAVTEYPSLFDSPVFTGEKYANLEANYVTTPVREPEVKEINNQPAMPVTSVAIGVEEVEQFSLTTKAKMVIGAVCATFVLMFSLVGINTQIINQKAKQIKNLEKIRKELAEQNEELQLRIQKAQSEESIREYALSQGMIQG